MRVFSLFVACLLVTSVAFADCQPPSATAEYAGMTDEGDAIINWSYTWRCNEGTAGTVLIYIDHGPGTLMPTDKSGQTQTTLIQTACTRYNHYFEVLAYSSGGSGSANSGDIAPVESHPAVSAAMTGTGPSALLHVNYAFPNTHPNQRYLGVSWDGNGAMEIYNLSLSGAVDVTPPECWKTADVYVRTCGAPEAAYNASARVNNPATAINAELALKPANDVGGNVVATLTYELPAGWTSGSVQWDVLPWYDEAGNKITPPAINSSQLVGPGPQTIQQWIVPPGGAHNLTLRVSLYLGNCPSVVKTAASDCRRCQNKEVGDPVAIDDGSTRYTDTDPLPSINGIALTRHHDSGLYKRRLFGYGWTSMFDQRLVTVTGPAITTAALTTEENQTFVFTTPTGGNVWTEEWPQSGNAPDALVYDAGSDTYAFRQAGSQRITIYRGSDGRIVTLRDLASGREATITWDGAGLPAGVSDSWSQVSWTITTDSVNRRITSIAVAGRPDLVWTYVYWTSGAPALKTVLAPGGNAWRTYAYFQNGQLTEARDGAGNLIESHTYAVNGPATGSIGPTDQISSIQYDITGSVAGDTITRVTYSSGSTTDYTLRARAGTYRTMQINGGCGSCGSRNAAFVYDDRGRVIRKQSGDGYVTTTTFLGDRLFATTEFLAPSGCDPATDALQCRLAPDLLASATLVGTSATRSTSYAYDDANWPDRATTITTTSVRQSNGTRTETITYDPATGTVLTRAITGWTGATPVQEQHTTTTMLYDGTAVAAFNPGGAFNAAWLSLPQPAGSRRSIDGPRIDVNDVTQFVYYPIDASVPSALHGHLAAVQNAAGHITRYENYDVFGNAQRVVDPNGVATEQSFDTLGRPLTSTLKAVSGCDTAADPLCTTDLVTSRTYSPAAGPVATQTDANGNVTTYEYDARTRLAAISRGPSSAALKERIETTYDPATGRKSLEKYLAMQNGSWVEKRRESFLYDTLAQLSAQAHSDSSSIAYTYDALGAVATVKDENHASANTTYTYDPAHRLGKVRQTLSTAAGGAITTFYGYDVAGNLTSVTDPNGNTTTYVYDDFGQMFSQTSPVTGTTTYAYDRDGNLLSSTDANGATTVRTYDALGRVTSSTSTRGGASEAVSWSYDGGAFGIGRLVSMTDPTGSTTYAYDRRGSTSSEAKTFGGTTYTTTYRYDANGNRSAIGYPSGRTASYTFDFANRPYSVAVGATPIVTSAAYLPFGPATSMVFANGTTRSMTYDARYRIAENKLTGPAGVLADYTYGEDAGENITAIHDALDARYNRDFAYDDLNRLTTANSGSALWGAGSYSYDGMGNMIALQVGRTASFTYAGTTPKLASVLENGTTTPVSYDNAGNETTDGATYSPRNHLTGSNGSPLYAYDGRGIRTGTSSAVTFGVASMSVAPDTLLAGSNATGTVTLNEPAAADTAVALSSNNAAVTVPSSVTVTAGGVNATFAVNTSAVTATTNVTITATLDTTSRNAALTLHPLTITTVSVAPATIPGGNAVSGTVTLSDPAPQTTSVALSSNNAAVTVPSGAVVASGGQSATFSVTTAGVSTTTNANVTATLNGSSQSAALTLTPAQLANVTTPATAVGGTSQTGSVALDGSAAANMNVSLSATSAVTVPPSVTIPAGGSSAPFSIATAAVPDASSQTVTATQGSTSKQSSIYLTPPNTTSLTLGSSVAVGGDDLVIATAALSNPAAASTYWVRSSNATIVATGTAPVAANATSAQVTMPTYPVSTPTAVTLSAGYFGTIWKTATVTVQPAAVTIGSVTLSPASIVPGNDVTGTITLTAPADRDIDVDLNSSYSGHWKLPPFVHFTAGTQQKTFVITTMPTLPNGASLNARHAMTTRSATLSTINPAVIVADLTVTPQVIVGGKNSNGAATVTLSSAPSANVTVTLSSSDPNAAAVPASVTVRRSTVSAGFTVSTSAVTTPKDVTITASYGGNFVRYTLTVMPANAIAVKSLVLSAGNQTCEAGITWIGVCTGTVTLTAAAPAGGAVVTLGGSRPYIVTVPPTITVPAGATSTTFNVRPYWVPYTKSAEITATYNGITRKAIATVNYDGGQNPPSLRSPDDPQPVAQCASLSILPCLAGLHPRAASTVPGTRYSLYTPELHLMAETYATSPAFAYEYIWFGAQPVAQIESATNTLHYYFTDHLGTPVLTTDTTATIDWRVEREPYGRIVSTRQGANRHQPLSLPGQEEAGAGDRAYNVFRWYRAGWGRYTQADPIGIDGGLNVYGYVNQSPINGLDPYGLEEGCKRKNICDELAQKIADVVRKMRRLIANENDPRIRPSINSAFKFWRQYEGHLQQFVNRGRELDKLRGQWKDDKCDGDPPGGNMVDAQYPDFDWKEFMDRWFRAMKQSLEPSSGPQIPFLPPMPAGVPIPILE